MKNKLLYLLPILCLLLSACFEMEETYTLNADGSYTSKQEVDMGGLMGMISTMLPDSVKEQNKLAESKDTTFNMTSKMPDSVKKKFTAEEYNALVNTDMNLDMRLSESVFKVGFTNKGKSINELNYFLSNFGNILKKGKVTDMIGNSLGDGQNQPSSKNLADDQESPFGNDDFAYVINDHTFQRSIKPEVFASKRAKNEKIYQMVENMKIKMSSTIIINLPKPATAVENPRAVLSADKKQMKLVVDLLETLKDPTILNFKVSY